VRLLGIIRGICMGDCVEVANMNLEDLFGVSSMVCTELAVKCGCERAYRGGPLS